ncbi:MAG: hypothetical protein WCQ96_02565 [Patescibacteria group bacterium]
MNLLSLFNKIVSVLTDLKFSLCENFNLFLSRWFSNWNFLNGNKFLIDKRRHTVNIAEIKDVSVNQIILVQPDTNGKLDEVAEQLKKYVGNDSKFLPQAINTALEGAGIGTCNEEINTRIDEIVALMKLGRLDKAKDDLLTILGEIKHDNSKFSKELGRIYNNLGVIYNRPKPIGDYDKAIEYFNNSIAQDGSLAKAKMNLASALINKGEAEGVVDGLDRITVLWTLEKNEDILAILLWGLYQNNKKADPVFEFIEKDKEAKEILKTSDVANNLLAILYLDKIDFENALKFANKAIGISPDEPEYLVTKAKALLIRAQEKYSIDSEFDIVPRLTDFKDVNKALDLFGKAKEIAEKENKSYLLSEIEYGIYTCFVWLGRYDDAKYKLKTLDISGLHEKMIHHVNVMAFALDLYNKDYELAYDKLVNDEHYDELSYTEKRRISRVFLLNGAAEQANQLLDRISIEAEQNKDISYWFDLSAVYVLLNKHQDAITSAKKVKNMADELEEKENEKKKIAYSHYNAVMHHYSTRDDGENSETSRLIEGMWEFQKQFPEEKIITPILAQDEKGELTQEIKDILLSARERYEKIKESFKDNPVPIYHLEKVLSRPFSEIMTHRDDPDFTIQFTGTDKLFLDEEKNNFNQADGFVFDYLSLLDLSKMGLLGFLEKLGRPLYIHELLFNKIQEELLNMEIEELRSLWDFIRKSKSVKIIRDSVDYQLTSERLDEIFEPWLIETLKIAVSKKIVLVTDDLNLYRFSKSESIKPINIVPILNSWKEQSIIDDRMYSRCLGDLAERYYIFISYRAEDLFEIVLEDKCKITPRSYHLVRQIFLPGSTVESFIGVFVVFIDMFWKTGSLSQDKVAWIKFLTNVITDVVDNEIKQAKDMKLSDPLFQEFQNRAKSEVFGLVGIWKTAIKVGSKDDLNELLKITEEVLNKEYAIESRVAIKRQIEDKIEKF